MKLFTLLFGSALAKAQLRRDNVLSVFTAMQDELNNSNALIDIAADKAEEQIALLNAERSGLLDIGSKNFRLSNKLSSFLD